MVLMDSNIKMCQAEDMGGWPACNKPATLQTKQGSYRRFYCDDHKLNRHVWKDDELEPIKTDLENRLDDLEKRILILEDKID